MEQILDINLVCDQCSSFPYCVSDSRPISKHGSWEGYTLLNSMFCSSLTKTTSDFSPLRHTASLIFLKIVFLELFYRYWYTLHGLVGTRTNTVKFQAGEVQQYIDKGKETYHSVTFLVFPSVICLIEGWRVLSCVTSVLQWECKPRLAAADNHHSLHWVLRCFQALSGYVPTEHG